MRTVINSITARLAEQGVTAYWVEVPDAPEWPYVVLWTTAGREIRETYGGQADHLDDRLGVTQVSKSSLGVLDLVSVVRDALRRWAPESSTYQMQPLALWDSRQVQPDKAVTLPNTNLHPYYAVDIYQLRGEPRSAD